MNKPSVFVGSSKGGLEFARAIRILLSQDADVRIWNEGLFEIGKTSIETLVEALREFDFAILVLTPDDRIGEGEVELFSPRDNVIFELALFIGQIGRSRTFIVQQANVKMPSDLFGVTTARYEWVQDGRAKQLRDYTAALGAACDQIRWSIRTLGPYRKIDKLAAELESVKDRQQQQDNSIQDLENFKEDVFKKLIAFSMSGFIYGHLKNIYFARRERKPLIYQHIGQTARRELQFLMDNGYIRHVRLEELKSVEDLADKIQLTPAGEWYIELREEMEGHSVTR